MRILGIGGSLRHNSNTMTVLKIALAAAEDSGATVELLDLKDLRLPFYQPDYALDDYPDPAYIRQFLASFQQADGFIWAAPTYHASPSAAFKNALDFLELLPRRPNRYLTGKVAALIALAGGPNTGPLSLNSMIANARALRLLIAPASMAVGPGKNLFDASGALIDEKMRDQLVELGAEVARLTAMLAGPRANPPQ